MAKNLRRRSRRAGNTMLESTLVFLAFMFLLLGMEEFGRMVFAYNFVAQAATEGARFASVRSSSCPSPCVPATQATIQAYVNGWAAGLNTANITVTPTWPNGDTPGNNVTVAVTYTWTAVVGKIVPASINFTNSATMLILQ
jgi:Flp pilus assembly protein TadG